MESIISPKRPKHDSWRLVRKLENLDGGIVECWLHSSGISVLSSVEAPEKILGAEYHVSVTKNGKRCTSNEGNFAIKAFDMEGADEDNHTLIARNYWRPVADNLAEHVCECKKTEPKIVMDKGDFIYRADSSAKKNY